MLRLPPCPALHQAVCPSCAFRFPAAVTARFAADFASHGGMRLLNAVCSRLWVTAEVQALAVLVAAQLSAWTGVQHAVSFIFLVFFQICVSAQYGGKSKANSGIFVFFCNMFFTSFYQRILLGRMNLTRQLSVF